MSPGSKLSAFPGWHIQKLIWLSSIHRFEEVNARLQRIEDSIAALTSAFRESATQNAAHCACKTQPSSTASPVPTEHSMRSPSPQAIERMRSVHFPGRSVGGRPFQEMTLQPQGKDGTDILYLGATSILTMSNDAQMLAEEKVNAHAHNLAIRDKPIQLQGRQQKQVMEAMGSLHSLNRISSNMAGFIPQFEHRSMRDSAAKVEFNIPTKAEAEELVKGTPNAGICICTVSNKYTRVLCQRTVLVPYL